MNGMQNISDLYKNLFSNNRKLIAKSIQQLHKFSIDNNDYKIEVKNFIDPHHSKDFSMFILDIFMIKNIGIIATGIVSSGTIKKGQKVTILKANGSNIVTKVLNIEHISNNGEVQAGDQIGLLLKNITNNDIQQGDRIYKKNRFFNLF